jgi:cation diffusion facilitator family transporter
MVSILNLFALKESAKPADKEHNYWHWKIEGIAAVIEWLIIIWSWGIIIFSSIKKIILWTELNSIDESIIVMIISIVVTGIIVFFLNRTAKRTNNLIIKADLIHYTMDFLTNTWIIIALVLVKYTWYNIIDPIIAIGIAIYIMFPSFKILKDGYDVLMDKSINKDKEIWKIILKNNNIESFHKLKTHKSWGKVFISFHIVFKDKDISLKKANWISNEIEKELKKHFKKSSILIRLDSYNELDK